MASGDPRLWGQRPSLSRLAREAECRSVGLEGEGRSWGGGRGAPWRPPHQWDPERGGPQSPPSMEDRGSYGASDMGARRRPWLPPRGDEEGEVSWGATNRAPQEHPRQFLPPGQEGRRGSCEPSRKRVRSPPVGKWVRVPLSPPRKDPWESPQKRVRSPPMDEWRRVPLSSPRGRGLTGPDSQRQPSASFSHATHREPSSRTSRRDSPSNGGSPWGPRGGSDGPATEPRGRSWGWPEPAWESCRDLETPPPASRRAAEGRDSSRSRQLREPGGGGSSSRHHRSRRDPGWATRHDDPVDEGWARDKGSSRVSIPQKSQGDKESFQGNFLGPKGGPERYEGRGTQAATTGTFPPHVEVVNYWTRCHHLMWGNERDKFLYFCPRPSIPDRSSIPPFLNPKLKWLATKHTKTFFTSERFSLQTQWDVLNMLAPAMALYEMAEVAVERQEGMDPLAVRPLACCLLSFAGSANWRLKLQRCSQVLQAIDPRLASTFTKMNVQKSGGLLFPEGNVNILKEAIRRLPKLPEEPPERNFDNRREEREPTLNAPPLEPPPLLQDGSASLSEMSSDQQVQLQDEASLELWHRRFGHADSATILRLLKDNLVTGIKVDPGEADSTARCLTCLAEKGTKPSKFSLNAASRSTALMDLIHCELDRPFNVPSLQLQRYVLIFVDDYSRYCVCFLLKKVSETHKYFWKYLTMLRRSYKLKPKAFQMNSAADSISPQTLTVLKRRGILHKRDGECIPGQSRTAKREMKSLLEMTRCMLADAKLPQPFWGHAIVAASYLWNRIAVTHMKSTPYQAWSGTAPCLSHLRVFGSLVRNGGDPSDPTQQVYVGYSFPLAKYIVLNLETGVVSLKSDLDFDEQQGVEKRGSFLVTLERDGCDTEVAATGVSVMPQTLAAMRPTRQR